jgi:hypothetical protein
MPLPFLAILLFATQINDAPPSPVEIQAHAALDQAWEARRRVLHALCGEADRERRMRSADARLNEAQRAYRARFRRSVEFPEDTGQRRWECTLPDGFEWTLASYHNALTNIAAVLAQ